MLCEWRTPVTYPLAALIRDLQSAIYCAERHIPVYPSGRLYGWLRVLKDLERQDRRKVAEEITLALQKNLKSAKEQNPFASHAEFESSAIWKFPYQDAFRSLLEARVFVHIVQH